MPRLYISATHQHAGKTTTSLGLFQLFQKMGKEVRFIKPIGQRYLERSGVKVDEDALLFSELLKCETPLAAMSPVAIPRGFTEEYIFSGDRASIYDEIDVAMMQVDDGSDVSIIEGTGHAGVGSVFDASNALVARLLGAQAIIIAGGGIGRCIDQICLNHALFTQEGVKVLGVIINKVLPEKYEKINRVVRQGLKNLDIECLGVIPYTPELTYPSLYQYIDSFKFAVLRGNNEQLDAKVMHTLIAADASTTLAKMTQNTLLIVPAGGIEPFIKPLIAELEKHPNPSSQLSALLLADGCSIDDALADKLIAMGVVILTTDDDCYKIAGKLGKMIAKIGIRDMEKVHRCGDLISDHIDADFILEGIR